jgi:hypothetical protein
LAASQVEVVHDWVDYLAAAGGFVGAGAAITALVFAKRSAGDATRSATAAEQSAKAAGESLAFQRQDAEEARRQRELRADPDVELSARAMDASSERPPGRVILDLAITNEDGTRPAKRLLCNVFVEESLAINPCDGDGIDGDKGRIITSSQTLGRYSDTRVWVDRIDRVERNITTLRHLRVDEPASGTYWILARLFHEDLQEGSREREWELFVPPLGEELTVKAVELEEEQADPQGDEVGLEPVEPEGETVVSEGEFALEPVEPERGQDAAAVRPEP